MNRVFLKFQNLMFLVAVAFTMFAVSCSDDNPVDNNKVNEAELLVKLIEATNNYPNVDAPKTTTAEALKGMNPATTHIVDIRSAEDFAKGYIQGAVNVPFANLVSHMGTFNSANYDVVIACYSGQTAAYGVSLLRMLGYNRVTSLKFGMSAWHSDFAATSWKAKAGNTRATQFVTTVTETPATTYSYPTLTTGKTTGETILSVRVDELLTKGFGEATVTSDKVFDNLDNYFIINYWPMNHYTEVGHIPGAYQFTPKEGFMSTFNLKKLPTDKTIVVYCYTGQTSAAVVAYLKLLGYDAKSLTYGTSGMINDIMGAKNLTHWDDMYCKNYDYVK